MNNILYKSLFFLIFIFGILNISYTLAYDCEYKGKIQQCLDAQNGSYKSIEDFICIVGNREEITYQIVLDMEFKKIDKEMDKYLETLEINKNQYFGTNSSKTYIDAINDINNMGDFFKTKYFKLCSKGIIDKVLNCSIEKKTLVSESLNYFLYNGSSCKALAEKKVSIFNDVAFGILMLNKEQILADNKKLYDQGQRSNYDHLLDIMMINIGYIERIWQKWPSKLANPMQ